MFAVFNRFDRRYEEAARDLGATPWQTFRHVMMPILLPSLIGVGLFGFTLSLRRVRPQPLYCRDLQHPAARDLRHDHQRHTPVLYALGTVTTGLLPGDRVALVSTIILRRRRERLGSDAGKAA